MATNTHEAKVNLSKRKAAQLFNRVVPLEDPKLQIELYEQVIKLDPTHSGAMNNLACLYLELKPEEQEEMEENRSIAKEYYEEAIKLGHIGAKRNLQLLDMVILSELAKEFQHHGDDYEKGVENKGIPDPEQAIEMYENAMDHYDAFISALDVELDNCSETAEEYKKIINDNKHNAEMNKAILQNKVLRNLLYQAALDSYNKEGPERRRTNKSAIKRYDMAIKRGHSGAMFNRARLYEDGVKNKGVPEYDKAIELYDLAKEHGDQRAEKEMRRLARDLFNEARRLYTDDEVKKAIVLYNYAAELGHAEAMAALGLLYETGEANNDEPDYKKAIEWYDIAISQGSTVAIVNKAHLCETGDAHNGVPDYKQAEILYKKAIKQGSEYAQSKLRLLEKKRNKEESHEKDKENIKNEMDLTPVVSGASLHSGCGGPGFFINDESRKRKSDALDNEPQSKRKKFALTPINV